MAQAEVAATPRLGYALAFAAGMLLMFMAGLGLLLAKPEVGKHARLALGMDVQQALPFQEPNNTIPSSLNQNDHFLAATRESQSGSNLTSSDALLEELLATGQLARDVDQKLVSSWAQQQFGGQDVTLQPLENREEVLTVREFKTNTGKRIRIYTNLVPETQTQKVY